MASQDKKWYIGYILCTKGCWEAQVLYDWDDKKDREKRNQYGFGFSEVIALFKSSHYLESSDTYPGQYRVIGYASNHVLVTAACEDRTDGYGVEFTWLATFWKATTAERRKYEE